MFKPPRLYLFDFHQYPVARKQSENVLPVLILREGSAFVGALPRGVSRVKAFETIGDVEQRQLVGLAFGGVNYADSVAGGQFGCINLANEVTGCQIGVINACDNITGIQIGAINLITTSPVPVLPIVNVWF